MQIDEYILKLGKYEEKFETIANHFLCPDHVTKTIIWFTEEFSNIESYAVCYNGKMLTIAIEVKQNTQKNLKGFEGIYCPADPPGFIELYDLVCMHKDLALEK
mgnify:CR=1 FL=1